MTVSGFCASEISEAMIIAVMASDVALLAAALIVVSLIDVGMSSDKAFSVASAQRDKRVRRLARMLQVLVVTSVMGFIVGVLTIWLNSGIVKLGTIVLGTVALLEFGIMTLLTLAIILSEKNPRK